MVKVADTSWLTAWPVNPLCVGQVGNIHLISHQTVISCSPLKIVNNETSARQANVRYQEVEVPPDFPLLLKKYLPNINYQPGLTGLPLRLVMLQVRM